MKEEALSSRSERGQRRYDEIVEAALEVFLERGYAATSLDAILARTGGSKETLYKMFGNKAGLLSAVCESRARGLRKVLDVDLDDADIRNWLTLVGEGYLGMALSRRSLALYRLICSETTRVPGIGGKLFCAGPGESMRQLVERLKVWEKRGEITVAAPERAADMFYAMLRGNLQVRSVLDPEFAVTPEDIRAHVAYVVDNFLVMCQHRPPG